MSRRRYPEYLIEAVLLAGFMVSATAFTVLLESPGSPVHGAVPSPLARRFLMGLAMAATSIVLTYSPWGGRSGAHLNPAVTVMFARLGRMRAADALGYVVAQFAGGIAGVTLAHAMFGAVVGHRSVNWVATLPGAAGEGWALAAEAAMTAVIFGTVLIVSSHPRWHGRTGVAAACCLALFITFEAPISGTSLNPARTFGPALLWASLVRSGSISSPRSQAWAWRRRPSAGGTARAPTAQPFITGPAAFSVLKGHPHELAL